MQENTQPYYFQAKPRVLSSRSIQQEEMRTINIQVYKNLMFEQKVIRGNTSSMNFVKEKAVQVLKNAPGKQNRFTNIKQGQKRSLIAKSNSGIDRSIGSRGNKTRSGCYVDHNERLSTNSPAFFPIGTQTETVLEKILPDLRYEFDYGIDKSTQIIESELFDFDKEVEPLVATFVSKILKESYSEVAQESELSSLLQIQEDIRNKSRVDNNNLKSFLEKEKEVLEASRKKYMKYNTDHQNKIKAQQKMVARDFTKHFLSKLEIEFEKAYLTYERVETDAVMFLIDKTRPMFEQKIIRNLEKKKSIRCQLLETFKHIDGFSTEVHKKTILYHEKQKAIKDELAKAEAAQKVIEKIKRKEQRALERKKRYVTSVYNYLNTKENVLKHVADNIHVSELFAPDDVPFVGLVGGFVPEILKSIQIVKESLNLTKINEFLASFFDNNADIRFHLYFAEPIKEILQEYKVDSFLDIAKLPKKINKNKIKQALSANLIQIHENITDQFLNSMFLNDKELKALLPPEENDDTNNDSPTDDNDLDYPQNSEDPKIYFKEPQNDHFKNELLGLLWEFIFIKKPSNILLEILPLSPERKIRYPDHLLIVCKKKSTSYDTDPLQPDNPKTQVLYTDYDMVEQEIKDYEAGEVEGFYSLNNGIILEHSFLYVNYDFEFYLRQKLLEAFRLVYKTKDQLNQTIESDLKDQFDSVLRLLVDKFRSLSDQKEMLVLHK